MDAVYRQANLSDSGRYWIEVAYATEQPIKFNKITNWTNRESEAKIGDDVVVYSIRNGKNAYEQDTEFRVYDIDWDKGTVILKPFNKDWEAYKLRRDERRKAVRKDDDTDDNENNNGNNSRSGNHGNTRLPYGIAKGRGIETEGMTPHEVWEKLAGEGVSPKEEYKKLKERGVEGKIKAEKPKGVNTLNYQGKTFGDLRLVMDRSVFKKPYVLRGKEIGAELDVARPIKSFKTKEDMFHFMRGLGVTSFMDGDKEVNPQEMDLPESVLDVYGTHYQKVSIGYRNGEFVLNGVDMAGKTGKIDSTSSLKKITNWLEENGVDMSKVTISPLAKKKEAERLVWTSTDKKEYITNEKGVKVGNLQIRQGVGMKWYVSGLDEEGERFEKKFQTKAETLEYLQNQGIESIKDIHGNEVDVKGFKMPKVVAQFKSFSGEDVKAKRIYIDNSDGNLKAMYRDVDGREGVCMRKMRGMTVDEFVADCKNMGVDIEALIDDEGREILKQERAEDVKKEERKKRFDKEAKPYRFSSYIDYGISKRVDGTYRITGYGSDGEKVVIRSEFKTAKSAVFDLYDKGIDLKDVDIPDDAKEEAYAEVKRIQEFDKTAVKIDGIRYNELKLDASSAAEGMIVLRGKRIQGDEHTVFYDYDVAGLEKQLKKFGLDYAKIEKTEAFDKFKIEADKAYQAKKEREAKAKELVESGKYVYAGGDRENVYTNIKVRIEEGAGYKITGTDADGNEDSYMGRAFSVDGAISRLESWGAKEYEITDEYGKVWTRPKDGMHGAYIRIDKNKKYRVYAYTDKTKGVREVYSADDDEACRNWLSENGVRTEEVSTKKMSPNGDIQRTTPAKSLELFDAHREKSLEKSWMFDKPDDYKNDLAEMMTTFFESAAYRVDRGSDHFADIIEEGYKSQIETNTGGVGACVDPVRRKRTSEKFFGHGGLKDNEYEKYGYIGLDDEDENWDERTGYGNMTITFKKDAVKDRTTWTFGDSLNNRDWITTPGYAGEYPTIEGFTSNTESNTDRLVERYREWKQSNGSPEELVKMIVSRTNYIECQYHGAMTVKDMERATFNDSAAMIECFSDMGEERAKNVIKLLTDNGVKLYYRSAETHKFVDGWEELKEEFPNAFV